MQDPPRLARGRAVAPGRPLPAIAAALVVSALALYPIGLVGSPLGKGVPDHSTVHLVRAGMLAVAAAILVTWIETRASRRAGPEPRNASALRASTYLAVVLAAAAAAISLLLVDPYSFFSHAREDAIVETAQVGLLILAAGLFAHRSVRGLRRGPAAARWYSLPPGLIALLLLVVVLEEVSWGQRLLGFEAGAAFASNQQGETNLHNFSTHGFELGYYGGLFAILVLLAYLRDRNVLPVRLRGLAELAPGAAVLLAAAPMVAFNYGEWNQPTVQLAVYTTVAILVAYAVDGVRRRRWTAVLPGCALVGVVAIQLTLLVEGDTMLRWWQNTEYKELLGTLALLFWALEVARRPLLRAGVLGPASVDARTGRGAESPAA